MTTEAPAFLPYGRQMIDDEDITAVTDVLRGTWLTGGPAVTAFEQSLQGHLDAPYATVCSTGTSALHIAYGALGVGAGDCVIVPAVTFLATANAADYLGAEVVFADVDPNSGLMMPEHAEVALARAKQAGKRVKLIAPVHLNGQTGDPEGMAAVAAAHGVAVVEDACHALGTAYRDRAGQIHRVGSCAHSSLACFSFHPVKTVAMGEGGAVSGASAALDAELKILRNHGMTRDAERFTQPELALASDGTPNPWYYEMVTQGNNYRASDMQCALGVSQLRKLPRFMAQRRSLVELYQKLLPSIPGVQPVGTVANSVPVWHLAVALIDFEGLQRERAAVMRALAAQGVGTQVHYMPVPWQPYWKTRTEALVELTGATAYYRRCLSLPLYPALTENDVERVVDTLNAVLRD